MGNRPKTARPKCYISEILAQVGKSASDQPICCSAQFRSGIIMAESTLMFAAAIIAGSSDAVPALHQPPSGIAPAHCGQRSNRLDPGWGGVLLTD